jgi:zinc transport system substrate-binding protein
MKKPGALASVILALTLVVISILSGCATADTARLKVVTSTSLISSIVERVGGDMVEIVNIIPPAQCPGHFDVTPGDIQKLADADLFLMHGWQGEKFSQELINSANNPDLTVVKLDAKVGNNDNWLTPSVQQAAVDKITAALSQADAANSTAYQEAAAEYKDKIAAKEAEVKARLAQVDLSNVNVMCADMLVGFVNWAGFNIVASYGRPESLTPQIVKDLVDKGKEARVVLIIDNLQSGQDTGKGIAEELASKRVILSNFPDGFDNTESWEKTIDQNIALLLEAIAR